MCAVPCVRGWSVVFSLVATLAAPSSAEAQPAACDSSFGACPPRITRGDQADDGPNAQSIDLTIMRPAIDSKGYITVNSSEVLRHLDVSFGLVANYGRNPLRIEGQGIDYRTGATTPTSFDVTTVFTGQLQAALGLFRFAEVAIGVPFVVVGGHATPADARQPGANDDVKYDWTRQGVGDVVLHGKARALSASRDALGLGLVLTASLPTSAEDQWTGEGQVQLRPTLVVDKEWGRHGRLRTALNVGYLYRQSTRTFVDDGYAMAPIRRDAAGNEAVIVRPASSGLGTKITVGDEIMYGVGASYALVPDKLDLLTEFFGSAGKRPRTRPGEWDVGLRLYAARNSYLTVAAGYGVNDSYASPEGRVFIGIVFEPSIGDRDGDGLKDDVDRCPDDPEDFDDFDDADGCPDPDNDRDGILDKDDRCPNVPETKNGFEDEDGCPDTVDLDRDGDHIPDRLDKCPDEAEDRDGFEDADGCPDPDNDRDGILDVDDLCPNDPEDFDGFEDKDGCPDPDNDRDRILDKDDRCPNQPEIWNGYKDEDGCPDTHPHLRITTTGIVILEPVNFRTDSDEILRTSFDILDAVGATLRGNPWIERIEIQGHCDERGNDDYNLDLSDRRVKSVRRYLVSRGVASGRMRARGYGETVPLCRRHNERCWAQNRRVQFVIEKRAEDTPGAPSD